MHFNFVGTFKQLELERDRVAAPEVLDVVKLNNEDPAAH